MSFSEFSTRDLTIAVCSIGRAGYLEAALESLLETTPPGVCLHLVLNKPSDTSLETDLENIVARWNGPSEVSVLPDRLDIAGSHNVALSSCSTRLITFMGDDDLVLQPRAEHLTSLFNSIKPTPAVVGSFSRRATGPPEATRLSTNKDYGPSSLAEWEAARSSGELIEVVFPSAVFHTERLRSIGGFEPRFGSAMDLASFTRLGMEAPVLADPIRSFAHRIHDGSVTTSAAAEHAQRVRYTAASMQAIRDGTEEPSWENFVRAEQATPISQRLRSNRTTESASLFRQGGAAYASGSRYRGLAKLGAAAMISPSTFLSRLRAQSPRRNTVQPTVSVLLKNLNQYRTPFYEGLRAELALRGIEFRLYIGDGMTEDVAKGDRAALSWTEHRAFRSINVAGKSLLWQPGFDVAMQSDVIITEQASKQLFNIVLAFGQRVFGTKHVFWGHGRNFQSSIEPDPADGLKRLLTSRAHWFLSYNDLSSQAAIEAGMPAERVTPVMNATDTKTLRELLALETEAHQIATRAELGLGDGPIGLYLGGIYEPKRPQFLIDAAIEIRKLLPTFELLILGDGSAREVVERAAKEHHWIHWMGSVYGDDRAKYASVCQLQLMPGLVGLNIVDAFALSLPTVTTDIDYHSPEIEYLKDQVNGLIVKDASPASYAQAVAELLQDDVRLTEMQQQAQQSSLGLGTEQMVMRFADGVVEALSASKR